MSLKRCHLLKIIHCFRCWMFTQIKVGFIQSLKQFAAKSRYFTNNACFKTYWKIVFYDSYDRVESHTTKVTGDEQTTQIHINVMPSNSSGTSASLIAVFIVVPLLFVGLVFLWWKRNKIRKLINNPFRCKLLYFMFITFH